MNTYQIWQLINEEDSHALNDLYVEIEASERRTRDKQDVERFLRKVNMQPF